MYKDSFFLIDRVVLVSNYTQTLNILQEVCKRHGYAYTRLDGQTQISQRQQIVDGFNSKYSSDFIFLLSSKAGGVGLNLIGGSHLILYDIDWNPATDIQVGLFMHYKHYRMPMGDTVRAGDTRMMMMYNNCCILNPYFVSGTLLSALHLFNLHNNPTSVDILSPVLQMKIWKFVLSHIAYKRQSQDSHPNLLCLQALIYCVVGPSGSS